MPRPHPKEFRDDIVASARQGETPIKQIAKDFGISESCLRNGLHQADVEDADYPGARTASACRTNVRNLAVTIRAGGTAIEHVTMAEYDDGALARLDADPPRALDA